MLGNVKNDAHIAQRDAYEIYDQMEGADSNFVTVDAFWRILQDPPPPKGWDQPFLKDLKTRITRASTDDRLWKEAS